MPKEDTQFKPGEGGRPKGVPNKLSRTVKQTVLDVFNILQDTPDHNLTKFAEKYPRDFYAIAAKLIPTELMGNVTTTVTHKITLNPKPKNDSGERISD